MQIPTNLPKMPTLRLPKLPENIAARLTTEGLTDLVNTYCGNTRKFIARLWYLTLFLSFIQCICSFVVIADTNAGTSFAAVWSMLMILSLAIGGTLVFRKYQTEAAIGFLLGTTAMMSQMFFVLGIIFASFSNYEEYGRNPSADITYAVFAFFLSISYGGVTGSLFLFRGDLVEGEGKAVSFPSSSSNSVALSGTVSV